jgi:hypothetical protein
LWYETQKLIEENFSTIYRVFVKGEPHKLAKADKGAWRLIVASSLPCQMAWKMLFHHQNEMLNALAGEIPSAHGFVFCYGGWRRFQSMATTKRLKYARDISNWDVNAPGWALMAVRDFRKRLSPGNPDWERIVDAAYSDAFENAQMVFSNGMMIQQTYVGSMKSGIYNTITDNSLAMVIMHIIASFRSSIPVGSIIATGDDVLQSNISDSYVEELEKLGCRVKMVETRLEFMGTDFTLKPVPIYLGKNLYGLSFKRQVLAETLDSYARLYAHSPAQKIWYNLASKYSISLHSPAYYRFWYDSPLARVMLW